LNSIHLCYRDAKDIFRNYPLAASLRLLQRERERERERKREEDIYREKRDIREGREERER
jgi:hypothetical protein